MLKGSTGKRKPHCKNGHERTLENLTKNRTCKQCNIVSAKKHSKENPKEQRECSRKSHLKLMHSLSLEEWELLLLKQDNKCAICHREFDAERKEFLKDLYPCVDHTHDVENSVRGLLCRCCNFLLGLAKDDITVLENAIAYLKFHKETQSGK